MKWLKILYVQVLIGIVLGVLTGLFYPETGTTLKPLAEIFIKAIKMLIAPIIFCTVVSGIASMGDLKRVGRVGLKALIYFEVLTTLALVIGLLVAGFSLRPGRLSVDRYDELTASAGMTFWQRFSTWDREPFDGGDYAVSAHRRTAPG